MEKNNSKEWMQEMKSNLQMEDYPPRKTSGGQTTGVLIQGVRIKCEDSSFEVACAYYRSKLKNRDKCIELYENYLESLKKEG